MSAFSADWLALRETADARARSGALVAMLPHRYRAILDLGAGTGANLRWLAPQLGFGQYWTLVDHDASLLAAARRTLADWARRSGFGLDARDGRLDIVGADFDCAVEIRRLDISTGLDELDIPAGSLVTASALLDLVSERWLSALVERIVARSATVLWALSYDGTVALDPAATEDDRIVTLVNRHQRTDKGFGPALGPGAWRVARDGLEQAGLDVHEADSGWDCSATDGSLLESLIDGWAEAAAAIAPGDDDGRIGRWREARIAQAAQGRLRARVGHRDLAAWPTGIAGSIDKG